MLNLFVLIFFFGATFSLLAWLYILFQPARAWDFQPVGDDGDVPARPTGAAFPSVAIIVPARNEGETLPRTLPALLHQDYPGAYQIYLVDDRSTDRTADIARDIVRRENSEARSSLLQGAPLPEGWMGKVWALDQGAKAASESGVEYFLLTDADILHSPCSLRRLVSESMAASLGLNSRMARLRCESPAERLLIPAFVWFFNILYPMRRANNPDDSLASAAGGCMLLSRDAWIQLGESLECIKSKIIDDINLARQVKGRGLPIRLSLSRTEVLSSREYPHLSDIWKMVRRTAFTELQYSWLRLAGALAGLALMFIVPLGAVITGLTAFLIGPAPILAAVLAIKGLIALAIMGHVYAPAMRFFKLPVLFAFSLPFAGVLYGLMTLDSAVRHARGKGVQWREPAAAK